MVDASELSDFRAVTFAKERAKILQDLNARAVPATLFTGDGHQFQFVVKSVKDEILNLGPVSPPVRRLNKDESIQLIFGLAEGLYLVRTRVADVRGDDLEVSLGADVHRQQRRNNFRVKIPAQLGMRFSLTEIRGVKPASPVDLVPIDLSAGGFRAAWPAQSLGDSSESVPMKGKLHLPGGIILNLEAVLKTVYPAPDQSLVGLEFQNLSTRDEQALLFACMSILRAQAPVVV
jgi:c-di-GMP-binding flagellar brake protein YcgR